MLMLASMQTLLTAIKYLFIREEMLTFGAVYLRSCQTLLTCVVYSRMALEAMNRSHLVRKAVWPSAATLFAYFSVLFIVALATPELPCHHPNWLLMSTSMFVVTVIFATAGCLVMQVGCFRRTPRRDVADSHGPVGAHRHEIRKASILFTSFEGEQASLSQKRRALWTLLLINTFGATVQLATDVWMQNAYASSGTCETFESNAEELARVVLRFLCYDLPVWAVIFVFYWLPRHQFDESLDLDLNLNEEHDPMVVDRHDSYVPPDGPSSPASDDVHVDESTDVGGRGVELQDVA